MKLIIACDGVWDVMTDQMAADIYARCRDPIEAARVIKAEALKRGTTDNVSVMCVELRPLKGS
jgi:serine/threonine protein phosphatase PrpC